jgi:hypothetical protein
MQPHRLSSQRGEIGVTVPLDVSRHRVPEDLSAIGEGEVGKSSTKSCDWPSATLTAPSSARVATEPVTTSAARKNAARTAMDNLMQAVPDERSVETIHTRGFPCPANSPAGWLEETSFFAPLRRRFRGLRNSYFAASTFAIYNRSPHRRCADRREMLHERPQL